MSNRKHPPEYGVPSGPTISARHRNALASSTRTKTPFGWLRGVVLLLLFAWLFGDRSEAAAQASAATRAAQAHKAGRQAGGSQRHAPVLSVSGSTRSSPAISLATRAARVLSGAASARACAAYAWLVATAGW